MNVQAPSPQTFDTHDEFVALNEDQKKAVEAIFQFLFSPEKEFMVSGPAGTGKTHLMNFVMRHTLRNYEDACRLLGIKPRDYMIELTATTNKATSVLAQATGFPTQTVHSFMNLKVKDNYKTGVSEIIRTPSWVVHTRTLIFVDEASMIDTVLHRFILEGTDKTCKIIYLGDHCQMAPVFEKISPVYNNPKRFAKLTRPMRNAGQPALMALCQELRRSVETLAFQPLREVPGVIDHVDNQGAYDFIERTFARQAPDARVLAFSNARVQEYNQHIRDLRQYPALFTQGETLVNNSALMIAGVAKPVRMVQIESEIEIVEASSQPYAVFADTSDPGTGFFVYDVRFREKGDAQVFEIAVPVDFEHIQTLMKHYARSKNWDRYFWLKNTFPDFRQRDATTVC